VSRLTSQPLKVAPANAVGVSVTTGGSAWAWGNYAEVIASASGALTIAGLVIDNPSLTNQRPEFAIAIGSMGNEIVLHVVAGYLVATTNNREHVIALPVPLGGIHTGARVSVAARHGAGSATYPVSLHYYEAQSSAHRTNARMSVVPEASNGVSVTPNGTAWADSAWVELTPGISREISLCGLLCSQPVATVDTEWEIGTGPDGGVTVVGTFRTYGHATTAGLWRNYWLPAPMPLAPNTRVAVRMRKAGTSTTAHLASLAYLDGTALL
jgi:hypothetical protein